MKMAYTPAELASIVAQLRNIKVNGDQVFRVEVEPTAIKDLKRVVVSNVQTTGNLEFALTQQNPRPWDGVLARWGVEDWPIGYEEALKIARSRIGETVPGFYEGEEWVITDIQVTSGNTIRAVVVEKSIFEVLKGFGHLKIDLSDD